MGKHSTKNAYLYSAPPKPKMAFTILSAPSLVPKGQEMQVAVQFVQQLRRKNIFCPNTSNKYTCTCCRCSDPVPSKPRCTPPSSLQRHRQLNWTIKTDPLMKKEYITVSITQTENLGKGLSLTRDTACFEKRTHFFGQPLVLLVEEHTDAGLSTSTSSAHLYK